MNKGKGKEKELIKELGKLGLIKDNVLLFNDLDLKNIYIDFEDSKTKHVDFTNAKTGNVDFRNSNVEYISFRGATFTSISIRNAKTRHKGEKDER